MNWLLQAALLEPGPAIPRPLWELLLILLGAFSTGCALLVVTWKVARPHIESYVKGVVKPLQDSADDTNARVRPNSGDSAHDFARRSYEQSVLTDSKVDDLSRLTHRNVRKITLLGEAVDGVRAAQAAHEREH